MNELKLLESEIKFNNRKVDLILKDINERLNILEDKVDNLETVLIGIRSEINR
jgi:hypothetical protein